MYIKSRGASENWNDKQNIWDRRYVRKLAGLPLVGPEKVQELHAGEPKNAGVLVHGGARVVGAVLLRAGGTERRRHAGAAGGGVDVAAAERHGVCPVGARAGVGGGEARLHGGGVAGERGGDEVQVRLESAVGRVVAAVAVGVLERHRRR